MSGKGFGMADSSTLKNSASKELFQKNYDLLFQRFPKLAFLAHSFTSRYAFCESKSGELNARRRNRFLHDPSSIAGEMEQWQKEVSWEGAEVVYVYGTGLGYSFLMLHNWLQEEGKKELVYLEDDPDAFISFLHTEIAGKVLQNPQAHLFFLFSKKKTAFQELADLFPAKKIEVLPAPHNLQKKKAFFARLRLELFRKTTLSEGLFLDRLYSYIPFRNFPKNLQLLPQSFAVNALKGTFNNIPAIVCGAGPSLKEDLANIRGGAHKALVIAGGSAITALSTKGINPHFGVMIDPNVDEYLRLKASCAFETAMIYNMRTENAVFSTFNGPLGYVRSSICSLADLWMEDELGITGPFLGQNLSSESLSVMGLCLAIAVFFGCNPIILAGVDLSYMGGKRYADGVLASDSIDTKAIDSEKIAEDRIFERHSADSSHMATTNVKWIMESSVLSRFAKRYPSRTFINASSKGLALKHIPYFPLQEALEKCPQQTDIQGLIFCEIGKAKFRLTKEKCQGVLKTLYESVQKCLECATLMEEETARILKDSKLAPDYQSGRMILAEMDIKEEIAYRILFYDTAKILDLYVKRSFKGASEKEKKHRKWHCFTEILKQYQKLLQS